MAFREKLFAETVRKNEQHKKLLQECREDRDAKTREIGELKHEVAFLDTELANSEDSRKFWQESAAALSAEVDLLTAELKETKAELKEAKALRFTPAKKPEKEDAGARAHVGPAPAKPASTGADLPPTAPAPAQTSTTAAQTDSTELLEVRDLLKEVEDLKIQGERDSCTIHRIDGSRRDVGNKYKRAMRDKLALNSVVETMIGGLGQLNAATMAALAESEVKLEYASNSFGFLIDPTVLTFESKIKGEALGGLESLDVVNDTGRRRTRVDFSSAGEHLSGDCVDGYAFDPSTTTAPTKPEPSRESEDSGTADEELPNPAGAVSSDPRGSAETAKEA